jgi:hypothetical protein
MGLTASAQPVPSPWEQPTAALAEQIAGILGPGQARLTIRNLSAVPTDEIPVIRRLLEEDLKARGVLASGAESANTIRVTLSENVRERLWVAEVVEGNETRVTMVRVGPAVTQQAKTGSGVTLRRQTVLTTDEEVLATLEIGDGLVAVEAEEIVIYGHAAEGWRQLKRVGIGQKKPLTRDPRGVILPLFEGGGFEAFVPGMECKGSYVAGQPVGDWTVRCRESDDPWPVTWAPVRETVAATQADISITPVRAFYNATRNYFTGVISPEPGVDSPPFYSAAWLFRSASSAPLVTGGIDGKVQAVENGALRPVSGTRDWGSDFAVLHSGCGTGTQIVASGSGEAAMDSLRAYEVPALEAVAASDPLAMDGTVTALGTAPDGKSVFAVVRSAADKFEVDRVTASCNE